MRRPFRTALLSWTAMLPAAGHGETLATAIAHAYHDNPTVQGARYDLSASDEQIVQALSELRPTASFQVTGGYDRNQLGRTSQLDNPFTPAIVGQSNNQTELIVEQPLLTGGRATADRRNAEAGVRGQREQLRVSEGDLLLAIITAYVDVRRYAATRDIWTANVHELEALTKEIRARRIAGELTLTDVAQADSQLEAARAQVIGADSDLEAARADYAALVGSMPSALTAPPPLPGLPGDAEAAYALAERDNPDLAQARYVELSSRESVASARAAGQPTVSLRASAVLSGQAIPYRFPDQDRDVSGSVVLSVPLSAGGLVASQVREAQDHDDSDRVRIEATRRALVRDVANAWNGMVAAKRGLAVYVAQRAAAATQLDGMVNEYRVGLRSTFDLLYAQQSLHNVDVTELGAARDLYVAQATLLRRTGALEVHTLLSGVPLYDPSEHLRRVEGRNALPWDGAVAALDRITLPASRQHVIAGPLTATDPAIADIPVKVPSDPDFSRVQPTAPIPGTAAVSTPHQGRSF